MVRQLATRRSGSTSRLQLLDASSCTSPATRPLSAGRAREMHKQRKVRAAVEHQLALEQPALEEEIHREAQERRRLMREVKSARTLQPAKVKVSAPGYFKPNPEWEHRPLPPLTKR